MEGRCITVCGNRRLVQIYCRLIVELIVGTISCDISMVQNISDESHVANHENVKFQFFNEKIVFKWE